MSQNDSDEDVMIAAAFVGDAHLIAAAPDMLAALKRIMEQPTEHPLKLSPEQRRELWQAHDQARAAMAKAEGAPLPSPEHGGQS